jgi:hypothetical protein
MNMSVHNNNQHACHRRVMEHMEERDEKALSLIHTYLHVGAVIVQPPHSARLLGVVVPALFAGALEPPLVPHASHRPAHGDRVEEGREESSGPSYTQKVCVRIQTGTERIARCSSCDRAVRPTPHQTRYRRCKDLAAIQYNTISDSVDTRGTKGSGGAE